MTLSTPRRRSRPAQGQATAGLRPCVACEERERLRRLYRKNGCDIVRCSGCGLVFTNEVPSAAELEAIYGETFFAVGGKFAGGASSASLHNARRRVTAILELPGVGRERWLDVGSATGDFLVAAAPFVRACSGIELSRYAVARARGRSLDVTCGDFLDVVAPAEAFDVVCMWDYLEHVVDPRANLSKAFAALKTGGYLALTTGDVDSPVARLMGRLWHLMIPPRHLYFFSVSTIGRLLTASGFEVHRVARPGKRVPLDFAAWKLASMVLPRAAPRVVRAGTALGLGQVALPINLFDIMTVYARKP